MSDGRPTWNCDHRDTDLSTLCLACRDEMKAKLDAALLQIESMKNLMGQAAGTIHLHLHDRPEDTHSNEDCKRPACAKLMAYVTGKKDAPLEMNRDLGWLEKMAKIEAESGSISVGGLANVPGSGFKPCRHVMKGDCSGNWWCDLCGKKM